MEMFTAADFIYHVILVQCNANQPSTTMTSWYRGESKVVYALFGAIYTLKKKMDTNLKE